MKEKFEDKLLFILFVYCLLFNTIYFFIKSLLMGQTFLSLDYFMLSLTFLISINYFIIFYKKMIKRE